MGLWHTQMVNQPLYNDIRVKTPIIEMKAYNTYEGILSGIFIILITLFDIAFIKNRLFLIF